MNTPDPPTVTAPGAPSGSRWLSAPVVIGAALALLAVIVLSLGHHSALSPLDAIILGAVEGITEFLPVSSTGHLLVTQRLLGLETGEAADTYAIAIQLGAILAVVTLYRHRLVQVVEGLLGRDRDGRRLSILLVVAFAPAAVVGIVAGDTIKAHLFGTWPVITAWIIGGVFLLWWRPRHGTISITDLTVRQAAVIGAVQLLAFWPGTSRSLVTIAAALAVGATMAAAVEFSFLLGLLTLGAATAFDLTRSGSTLIDDYGWRTPLLGAIVAFVTAVLAIHWLVAYLRTRPLTIFGWYRLGMAAITLVLLAVGAL